MGAKFCESAFRRSEATERCALTPWLAFSLVLDLEYINTHPGNVIGDSHDRSNKSDSTRSKTVESRPTFGRSLKKDLALADVGQENLLQHYYRMFNNGLAIEGQVRT
ncbi:hypothetical protein PGT21_002704 [Puccinia graminis f. sp. tritici]|uniref:Uncharacterized protein n=1 Tax=Puccinia graminis f. sp. tritici TaxID=56615 RepID=A0A5B0MCJ0_PUCGR|nr:hypothetical protein PGTUg99_009335 [Puccinia graminis f. sp. tritici]KAA1074362.1 hypothetical protein PGT21_002704 [Puccinia graminis f. sp. tritici]